MSKPSKPQEPGGSLTQPARRENEPHWQGRAAITAFARKEREAKESRDLLAEALEAIPMTMIAQPHEPIIAALMIAQALDRLGKTILEAAAVASYKRG